MTLPRAIDPMALRRDIFAHLSAARAQYGPRIMVHDGPLFSRSPDCPGVVALLDPPDVQEVLSDAERFRLPRSGALAVDLPDDLVALNRSLHSLDVAAHRTQRMPLARTVTALDDDDVACVARIVDRHIPSDHFPLQTTMRALTGDVAARLIFGDDPAAVRLGATLSRYFALRSAATALGAPQASTSGQLIEAGRTAASDLFARVSAANAGGRALADRLMATGQFETGDLVGHLNILYISSTEPLAAVLGWTLLILSQRPDLQAALGCAAAAPNAFTALLKPILLETMRVLTPNALMTRVANVPVMIGDCRLAAGTEILMAPLLMHRDPAIFAHPARFDRHRWDDLSPPPFSFLPFGGGVHACIGRAFAMSLLTAILRALFLGGLRPALSRTEVIDWRMAIVFQPAGDVIFKTNGSDFPPWRGPVSTLVDVTHRN